jgi:guanylate kinase
LYRGTETEESIQKRLTNAKKELSYLDIPGFFDHVIINDDVERAFQEFERILLEN